MSDAGVFNPAARAAIIEAGHGRCVGCGRPDVTCQHRRARGMGGTSDVVIGHPANGVPLCGDGVRGCHGWAEKNPRDARLLGWALAPGQDALEAPFYDRVYGWRRWTAEAMLEYVDPVLDLLDLDDRLAALARYRVARPLPVPVSKSQR